MTTKLPFDGGETPEPPATYTRDEFYAMHAEYETEYTALLETIARLKEALRHIHLTASKATPADYDAAIDWIEGEASRVLKETAEPLAGDTCGCGNAPVASGYRVCENCAEARELYPDLFEDDKPDEIEVTE